MAHKKMKQASYQLGEKGQALIEHCKEEQLPRDKHCVLKAEPEGE